MKLVSLRGFVAVVAVFCTIALQYAYAYASKDDFRIAYFTIDTAGTPRLLQTDLIAFIYSKEGRPVAGAIAEYFNIDPTQVNTHFTAARSIRNVVVRKKGEETSGHITFDSRYSICRVVAAGPFAKGCGSQLFMTVGGADGHQVSYHTSVPAKNAANKSICTIDAKFVALLVKRELKSKARCAPNNEQVMECAGDICAFGPDVSRLF